MCIVACQWVCRSNKERWRKLELAWICSSTKWWKHTTTRAARDHYYARNCRGEFSTVQYYGNNTNCALSKLQ